MELLLLILTISQPDLVIVYDDSPKSTLLVSELTRDWHRFEGMSKYEDIICDIHSKVNLVLVHRDDVKLTEEYRVPYLRGFPQYKFGRYSRDFSEFDPRTFGTSTHPLKTVQYIIREHFFDDELREWGIRCNKIILDTEGRNWAKLVDFMLKHNLYECFYSVEEVRKNYGNEIDFPKLESPKLPEKPELESPWK